MSVPQKWFYAAVEAAAGCEAHPLGVPEGVAPPFVIYTRSGTAREQLLSDTLDDEPASDAMPPVATFEVQIYAATYVGAWDIADAVRAAVHKFSGVANEITVESCLLAEEQDGDPVFLDGQDKPTYVVNQTYQVRWVDD